MLCFTRWPDAWRAGPGARDGLRELEVLATRINTLLANPPATPAPNVDENALTLYRRLPGAAILSVNVPQHAVPARTAISALRLHASTGTLCLLAENKVLLANVPKRGATVTLSVAQVSNEGPIWTRRTLVISPE